MSFFVIFRLAKEKLLVTFALDHPVTTINCKIVISGQICTLVLFSASPSQSMQMTWWLSGTDCLPDIFQPGLFYQLHSCQLLPPATLSIISISISSISIIISSIISISISIIISSISGISIIISSINMCLFYQLPKLP